MRNHEVTQTHPLLNSDGSLMEPGWSRKLVQTYSRDRIRGSGTGSGRCSPRQITRPCS